MTTPKQKFDKDDFDSCLKMIMEGRLHSVMDERYIYLDNPYYSPDNGQDPLLEFDTKTMRFTNKKYVNKHINKRKTK